MRLTDYTRSASAKVNRLQFERPALPGGLRLGDQAFEKLPLIGLARLMLKETAIRTNLVAKRDMDVEMSNGQRLRGDELFEGMLES